jgi:hypothetical protein
VDQHDSSASGAPGPATRASDRDRENALEQLSRAALPGAPVIDVRATAILGNVTVRPPTIGSRIRAELSRVANRG